MAFPIDPLPIRAELLIDGAWVDIAAAGDVRLEDSIQITNAGRANEQGTIGPTQTAFTLDNTNGKYSNRNPNSTYYGKLGQNTPARFSIEETTPYLRLPAWISTDNFSTMSIGGISTTDKAVLDVTGDLDLRIEIQPDDWTIGSAGQVLAGKYNNATTNRSWFWSIQPTGFVRFAWSADGNNAVTNGTFRDSTVSLPGGTGRFALRVAIDVNNGAAGHTVTFYTSDSISGTWTQLGSPVVTSGTTSIFSGNGDLWIGKVLNSAGGMPFTAVADGQPALFPLAGRVYAFEMRNSAGTLVAKMDATSRSEGDTSWSDGLATPNTWTVTAPGEITQANYRSYGQVGKFPVRWDPTGVDVTSPVVASGILQQLTQGVSNVKSPVYNNLSQFLDRALAYWPCEDESQSTSGANAVAGGQSLKVTDVTFGPESDFPASAGVVRMNSSASLLIGRAKAAAPTNNAFLFWYFRFPSIPGADVPMVNLYFGSGKIARVNVVVSTATYKFTAFDNTDTSVGTSTVSFGTGAEPNQWVGMRLILADAGSDVLVSLGWYPIGAPTFFGTDFTVTSATLGAPIRFTSGLQSGLADVEMAHFLMGNFDYGFTSLEFVNASLAYLGETAGNRWLRVAANAGINVRLIGVPADTELMGAQPIDTPINIMQQCVDLDGGRMFEPRDMLAIAMRTRRSLIMQGAPQINYAAGDLSGDFSPTDDDALLRNFVTVTRPGGSEATAEKTDGPRSTLPVEDGGVGKYDTTLSRNSSADSRLSALAEQEVFIGTWDEPRYPSVQVQLERSNYYGTAAKLAHAAEFAAIGIGDRLSIINTPVWLPAKNVELLIEGYNETLANRNWVLRWFTSPYGPYLYVNNLTFNVNTRTRACATNSVLAGSLTATATSFTVTTATGAKWRDSTSRPSQFPITIQIGGELMSVGTIAAPVGNNQLFSNVIRSQNGIVKTHDAGDFVQVDEIFYASL